jgi:putative DNA-invertase from lambdoid prophage Rac
LEVSIWPVRAEFEKDLLVERTRAGLSRAKAAGKVLGRRSSLTDSDKVTILSKRSEGVSLGLLAKEYGVSRSAIQRVEKGSGSKSDPVQ